MGVLSNRQFHDRVRAEGGASRDIHSLQEAPSSGGFVSTPGSERTHTDEEFTPHAVGAHLKEARANKGTGYQGGWENREAPERPFYLDHSRRTLSVGLAVGLGHVYGQDSVYAPRHPAARASGGYIKMNSALAKQVIAETRVNGSNYPKRGRSKK